MGVLVVAPSRPDLPNVAQEAAAVVNALGGQLVQGQVTERDIRDAASADCFDGIWFATHVVVTPEREIRALLSDEFLSETALLSYVAASGASWCFINTCQSITGGLRIIDETPADVICTISEVPDQDAMRTGVLFARQLAQLSDPREAYERSKPGGNRLYVYLQNHRQHDMTAVGSNNVAHPAHYPAQDRLQATMDDMRKDLAKVGTDVEVLKSGTVRLEARQQRIEDRLSQIEHDLRPTPTWQTWAMLSIGAVMCTLMVLLLLRLGGG